MNTMARSLWLCTGVSLLVASAAQAQVATPATEKFFVNVNFGAQLVERTLESIVTETVYDETATMTSSLPIGRGPLFDVSGGYRVYGDVYVGVAISRFGHSGDGTYSASIPDPVVFGRPKTTSGTEAALSRTELSISPNVTWVMPLTDKFDISVGGGVAIVKLTQELPTGLTVPAGTQNVIPIITEESATATGLYAAVDIIYNLAARYGVGGFVRYSGGKTDLDSSPDQSVGGMQAGGGIRLRF
jgi:hypothetical protein